MKNVDACSFIDLLRTASCSTDRKGDWTCVDLGIPEIEVTNTRKILCAILAVAIFTKGNFKMLTWLTQPSTLPVEIDFGGII